MKRLLLAALCSLNLFASQEEVFPIYRINKDKYIASEDVDLFHWNNQFYVVANNKMLEIDPINMDKALRNIDVKELVQAIEHGYISVKESDDSFSLQYNPRFKGGGFMLACATWWTVQVAGYTSILTGALLINTALPGVGGLGMTLMGGTGGVAGLVVAINAAAAKAAVIALTLPTP